MLGGMQAMKMEPWNLSSFCLLFFSKLSLLHYPTHLPSATSAPFTLLVFLLPCPLVSTCPSSEALHLSLLPPFSNFPEYHNFLLCLEQVTPPALSYPVSSAPTWKASFFWCSWGSSSYSWVVLQFGLWRVILGERLDQSSMAQKGRGKADKPLKAAFHYNSLEKNHLFLWIRQKIRGHKQFVMPNSWMLYFTEHLKNRVSLEIERIWKKKLVECNSYYRL